MSTQEPTGEKDRGERYSLGKFDIEYTEGDYYELKQLRKVVSVKHKCKEIDFLEVARNIVGFVQCETCLENKGLTHEAQAKYIREYIMGAIFARAANQKKP